MQAPLTVSDRIAACLVKSEQEGLSIKRFFLGRKEIDCLLEWADKDSVNTIYRAQFFGEPFEFMGSSVHVVDRESYFSYEVEEPALV